MSMGLEIASAVTGHYGHTHEKNLVIENIFLMHKVHNRWLGSHRNTYSWNLIHLSCYLQLAASEIGLKWENTQPSFERRLAIIRKNRGLSPRHG